MFGSIISSTAFTLIATAVVLIYFYVKYLYSYWWRRGVPYLKPSIPFGNFGNYSLQRKALGEQLDEFYRSTEEPVIGVYSLFRPTLVVRDPELIRNVLIKDFQHFTDRGVYVDEENDPMSAHLFALEGERWKSLRSKFTPAFSSGKFKAIFNTLVDCKDPLEKHLAKVANSDETVEVRDLMAYYTTNVIASVAFGIEIDCFADPNTPFRKYGRQIFEPTLKNAFRFFCFLVSPTLLKWSGIHWMDREVENFMFDLVKRTLGLRETNNIVRKDFFQLLVQLRNSGNVQLDDEWGTVVELKKTLTIEEVTAHAFIFYVAGFETTSSTMSFLMYEIARHPDVQQKIYEEFDRVLAQYDGELTYDAMNELKYLDSCIDETLRLYPSVQLLNRICVKDYKIPETNMTVEKGTPIIIPIFSLHRDEKYYPDPEKFNPLRFFNKTTADRPYLPYLPFGEGPRYCIGMRMGKFSTKVGIVSILRKYHVELGQEHIGKELKFSAASFPLTSTTGIQLKFKDRHSKA